MSLAGLRDCPPHPFHVPPPTPPPPPPSPSTTAGDDEARNRGTQKSVLERKAPPTFPLVIEMRERALWVTHWVEDSVDCLLTGKVPIVQVGMKGGGIGGRVGVGRRLSAQRCSIFRAALAVCRASLFTPHSRLLPAATPRPVPCLPPRQVRRRDASAKRVVAEECRYDTIGKLSLMRGAGVRLKLSVSRSHHTLSCAPSDS